MELAWMRAAGSSASWCKWLQRGGEGSWGCSKGPSGLKSEILESEIGLDAAWAACSSGRCCARGRGWN